MVDTVFTPLEGKFARWSLYALLAFFALYYLAPLGLMVVTSLKSAEEIRNTHLLSFPHSISFAAWGKAWSEACIGLSCTGLKDYFWNSILLVIPTVFISTIFGALNGYVLSLWRFKGSQIIFTLMLFGCFLPFQVVILPMARMLGVIGLANSRFGLVFVHIVYGLAFTTLFFRNFYITIPKDLVRAATLDGAGFFTFFQRVLLPVSLPTITVTVIWQFTAIWNDFLFGAVFSAGNAQPITVALNNLVNTSTGVKEYNVDMAATLIAGLPTLVVYIFAGKYFVRGLTAGAVKG